MVAALRTAPAWAASAAWLVAGLAIGGVLWEAAVVLLSISPHYVPPLSRVLAAMASTPGAYIDSVARTAAEAVIGYVSGGLFGIGAGILFFRVRLLRDMFFPIFIISQTIPVIAFGAVIVLWFGNTLLAKAVLAFYLSFFPVTVNTLLGLESADPQQVQLLQSFGGTRWQLLWRLQFPGALPQIFVALRLAASLCLVGAIVGEWFGDTVGLGVLLLQAVYNENMVGIWAALLASALLGGVFYAVVSALERSIVFWGSEQ
jgi:NitT/TauT family transport system permease protein